MIFMRSLTVCLSVVLLASAAAAGAEDGAAWVRTRPLELKDSLYTSKVHDQSERVPDF
jgi:hypothetical protein